jgi:amidase
VEAFTPTPGSLFHEGGSWPDLVREQADGVDRIVARGENPGPLAGVPVTVKINTDQAGFATANGTWLQKDLVAQASSPAVDNPDRRRLQPRARA